MNNTILLVDDSLLASKVLSDFLNENGYKTETVPNGQAAIQRTCSADFDLILMDIELGTEMNGIEAARQILKSIDIPVIFFTAHSSKDIFNTIKGIPAYGFVLKGMDKYALLSTIEMALNLYKANSQTKEFNGELKKAHEELEASRKQYLELAENAPVGILKCDHSGAIKFINQKALEIIGSPDIEETKKINLLTFPALVHFGLSAQLEKCLKNKEQVIFESSYESKWGKKVSIRLHIKPVTDRYNLTGAQLIVDDISEKKHLEEELRRLSLTDPLTGIYNRRFFIQKLEEEIERVQRESAKTFCIAMLDVDHFKTINDYFGHHSGDNVLKTLTKVIKRRLRKVDCLARWGGEEFMILLPDTHLPEAMFLIEELRKTIAKMVSPIDVRVTASFGVVEYRAGDTVDYMLQKVDNLMYEAKNSGRNCVRS